MKSNDYKVGMRIKWINFDDGRITAEITSVDEENYHYDLYENGIFYGHRNCEKQSLQEMTRRLTKLEQALK